MKTKLMPIMLTAVFTVNAFADVELKRKHINTVEDVKEYRAQVIDKMTERLDSGELNQQQSNVIAKKIALLSDKPLPTQEQIDNPNGIKLPTTFEPQPPMDFDNPWPHGGTK